jgi:hypothetical protein
MGIFFDSGMDTDLLICPDGQIQIKPDDVGRITIDAGSAFSMTSRSEDSGSKLDHVCALSTWPPAV